MAPERLTISCDECVMAGTEACADCLVTFVVGGTIHALPGRAAVGEPPDVPATGPVTGPAGVHLTAEQARAVRTLAGAGLVSELRFVRRAAG